VFRNLYVGTFMIWRVHGFVFCCVLSLNTTFIKCFIHFLVSSVSFLLYLLFREWYGDEFFLDGFTYYFIAYLMSTSYTDIIIRIITLLQIWMV